MLFTHLFCCCKCARSRTRCFPGRFFIRRRTCSSLPGRPAIVSSGKLKRSCRTNCSSDRFERNLNKIKTLPLHSAVFYSPHQLGRVCLRSFGTQAVEIQRVYRAHRDRGAVHAALKDKAWAQNVDLHGWASTVIQRCALCDDGSVVVLFLADLRGHSGVRLRSSPKPVSFVENPHTNGNQP